MRSSLLVLILLVLACRPEASPRASGIVDDLGNRIALTHEPRRIVSLSPATTELLFALGWGDRLVGRTRYCDYPAEATQVPDVGEGLSPNIEAIAARKPDLVVMYATAANAPAVQQLGRLGIAAVNVKMDRLKDLPHSARLLASLIGDSARVDSIAARYEHSLDSLAHIPRGTPRRVAMIVWDNPPIVIGAGSFLSELVSLAGGKNVFDDVPQPSPTVSIETIAARNPDLLLFMSSDSTGPSYGRRPEWQPVRAVRERHFGSLHGSEFDRPSPRMVQAVIKLEALFRPGGK